MTVVGGGQAWVNFSHLLLPLGHPEESRCGSREARSFLI